MSEPVFGVVTAVGRPEYDLIQLAAESLGQLRKAGNLAIDAIQWVVVLDAPAMTVAQDQSPGIAANHRARLQCIARDVGVPIEVVENRAPGGSAIARNVALDRLVAPWMLTLDSDDVLVPAGILALHDALRNEPGAAWAAGRCPHMDREGVETWAGPEDPFAPGPVAPGAFWAAKLRLGGLPFVCTATVASTAAVRAVGGWPSKPRPRAADTALWAVLTSRFRGLWVPEVVYRYRRHSASVTMQPGFRGQDERLSEIARMIELGTTQLG